jgi:hypothetical protein
MTNNTNRQGLFFVILAVLMLFICEFAFRLTLWSAKDIPFLRPDLAIKEHFFKELKPLQSAHINAQNDSIDILILGGSVVADEWRSKVARNLRDSLIQALHSSKIRYFNLANLGHNTVDNLYKYRELTDKRFDLVIYYEGINETRFNNIPADKFRSDYTHVRWYHDIALIREHSEMRYTVIPFTVHLLKNYLSTLLGQRYFINDAPDPKYYSEGSAIKTAPFYKNNLAQIIAIAQKRKEPFLMVNFTYYIPERWRKSSFRENEWDFAPCDLSSPIKTWGSPLNVEKGILVHRSMMKQLAASTKGIYYFDMNDVMPKEGTYFCDICHFTDAGSKVFAHHLAGYILDNKLVKTSF